MLLLCPFRDVSHKCSTVVNQASIAIKFFFLPQAVFSLLLGVVFTAPYAYYMHVDSELGVRRCAESWSGMPRTVYGAFVTISQFVAPFLTIFVCYG